jgi:DnaK suppressor protein
MTEIYISREQKYSRKELDEFKLIILQRKEKAESLLSSLLLSFGNGGNGTDDTYRSFQCLEEGQDCLSKEELGRLIERQKAYIIELNEALVRIETGEYGICRITKTLIAKERLRCVPHATLSIAGKNMEKELNGKNGIKKKF